LETRHAPIRHHPRVRRWMVWLTVVVVVLTAYAIALRWFTLRVESGIQASIHPATSEGQPHAPE